VALDVLWHANAGLLCVQRVQESMLHVSCGGLDGDADGARVRMLVLRLR